MSPTTCFLVRRAARTSIGLKILFCRQIIKSLKPRVIQVSPRQLALHCDVNGPDGQPLTDQLLWERIRALMREAMRHPIQHLQPPESP